MLIIQGFLSNMGEQTSPPMLGIAEGFYTGENAKVVAAAWETELIKFLATLVAILH